MGKRVDGEMDWNYWPIGHTTRGAHRTRLVDFQNDFACAAVRQRLQRRLSIEKKITHVIARILVEEG